LPVIALYLAASISAFFSATFDEIASLSELIASVLAASVSYCFLTTS
jgi:hypothetical protein